MTGKEGQGSALKPAQGLCPRAPHVPGHASHDGPGSWTALHWSGSKGEFNMRRMPRHDAGGPGGRRPAGRRSLIALTLLIPLTTHAVEPAERLPDPAMETRARAISAELRCLVCQNESIDESHADLARDIRALVRRRLTLGDSDTATVQAVVDRYGDFVLLRPPIRRDTWILWYGPVALLLTGLTAIAFWLRRPSPTPPPTPLTEEEHHRLTTLTREDSP